MTDPHTEEKFIYPDIGYEKNDFRIVGDTWSAWQNDSLYILEYVSGELAGRVKKINITQTEYQQLRGKQITIEQLLIAHASF